VLLKCCKNLVWEMQQLNLVFFLNGRVAGKVGI
jgi:hypothetical protein